jgi:hypothetical protein
MTGAMLGEPPPSKPRVMLKIRLSHLLACLPLLCTPACQMKDAPTHAGSPMPGNSTTVRIGSIDWLVDYDSAREFAQKTGKPMWLHFGENPG